MKLPHLIRALSLRPEARVIQHLEHMRESIHIPPGVDRKNFDAIYEAFSYAANRLKMYRFIRGLFFVLLYISVIAAVASEVAPFFGEALQPLVRFSSVIGVGVLTLLFLGMNRIVAIVQMELVTEHSHLVAIAVKHNKEVEMHPKYYLGLFPSYESK